MSEFLESFIRLIVDLDLFSSILDDEFGKLKSPLELVNFVYKDFQKYAYLFDLVPIRKQKNDESAIKIREAGNEFFKAGKYREALTCYTRSIMNAESKDVLALAYGNRSAALSKLDFFEECLEDIERAFQNDYPDDLKKKLLQRQELAVSKKSPKEKPYESVPDFPEFERNPLIQSARNCVEIKQNEEFGRHVVATRRIEVGQIIAVEKPYSLCVNENELEYCHECCELRYNMIPCENCTIVLYCSEECKRAAYDSSHKYECQLLNVLNVEVVNSSTRLVLKMIFIGAAEWSETDQNADPIYRSDRFKEIHNLKTHTENLPQKELYITSFLTCFLFYHIKKYTTFLADYNEKDKLKELIFHTLLLRNVNGVVIQELNIPKFLQTFDYNYVASCVYSFFSLFNHSCWPNVMRTFHGSRIVLRAINTIQPGEQCFVDYGVSYKASNKGLRCNILKKFFFTCKCRACNENWPTFIRNASLPLMLLVKESNVPFVKSQLPRLLYIAKEAERTLSAGEDYLQKEFLSVCYMILGNKRRI